MRSLNTTITALLPVMSLLVVGSLDPRRQRARGVRRRPAHRPVLGRLLVDLHRLAAAGAAQGARAPLPRHQAPHRQRGRRRRGGGRHGGHRPAAGVARRGRRGDLVGGAGRTAHAGKRERRRGAEPSRRRAGSSRRGPARRPRQAPLTAVAPGAPPGRPLSSGHDARSIVAGRPPPRRPRLPAAGHRVQGHHAAARPTSTRSGHGRRHRRPRRRPDRRQGRRHRGPGLHLRRAGRLPARRRVRAGAQAGQAALADGAPRPTSSSTAPTRSRSTRTPSAAGDTVYDRRRRARHRRHGRRHLPRWSSGSGGRDRRAWPSSSSWASSTAGRNWRITTYSA